MSRSARFGAMLLMVLLGGTYIHENTPKLYGALWSVKQILNGDAPQTLSISVNGSELTQFPLLSSDLFDASGSFQVVFHRVAKATYTDLQSKAGQAQIAVNGVTVPLRLLDQGRFLQIVLPDKIAYIVVKDDMRQIARLVWSAHANARHVVTCMSMPLCRGLDISGDGWGPMEGPYMRDDIPLAWPGLPRGRWGFGPRTELHFRSQRPARVIILVRMLSLSHYMQLNVSGASIQKVVPLGLGSKGRRLANDVVLYPMMVSLVAQLETGGNDIDIGYSRWRHGHGRDPRPLAAYITGIEVFELP